MAVSIVIPTYNGRNFISSTLEGVFKQTWTDWELVVVDDGSNDDSRDIVRSLLQGRSNARLIESANCGESAARNLGLRWTDSRRPFVIFLDHDDVWTQNALSSLVSTLDANPSASAAHALGAMINAEGAPIMDDFLEQWGRRRKRIGHQGQMIDCDVGDPTTLETMSYHICVATTGLCLFRRSALPTSPFPEEMRTGGADYHVYLDILRRGQFAFIDQVLIHKRLHTANITNDNETSVRGLTEAFRAIWFKPDTTEEQRQLLESGYRARNREEMLCVFSEIARAIRNRQVSRLIKYTHDAIRLFRRRTVRKFWKTLAKRPHLA